MDKLLELLAVDQLSELLDVREITTMVLAFIPKLVIASVLFTAFWIAYRLSSGSLSRILCRGGLDPNLVQLLVERMYKFLLLSVGVIMAASQLGINVAAALAGLGVAGIAIGFAAQDMLSNIISGFVIFWDQPFRVGDFIDVDGQYGRVHEITLRSTRIRTTRNAYVIIPNRNIVDNKLVNKSKNGQLRIDVPVGIAYKENILDARRVLLAAMKSVPALSTDPEPAVVVTDLGDSSVNLEVRVWIDDAESEVPTKLNVVEASKLALDAADIQIPFPHMQLFVDGVTDEAAAQLARRGA